MINQYHYEESLENREQHEDYYTVLEEYSETELFKEILHFINLAFPEWTSNKGIGTWAGEFVLNVIRNTIYLENREEYTQREMLIALYVELADQYQSTQTEYQYVFNKKIINDFDIDNQEELKEKEQLSFEKFSAFYDELFTDYKNKELEKIIYNFQDDLIF